MTKVTGPPFCVRNGADNGLTLSSAFSRHGQVNRKKGGVREGRAALPPIGGPEIDILTIFSYYTQLGALRFCKLGALR